MPREFILTLMTDDFEEAIRGAAAKVDRIGPDLETYHKAERQATLSTRVSAHDADFVARLKGNIAGSELFARIDPIQSGSKQQIDALIGDGVVSLMLPYFHSEKEVSEFVGIVDGRARTTILVETAASAFLIESFATIEGVDEVHIGLTDLMISTKAKSRYRLLTSPLMDLICEIVLRHGKPLHLAGVARIDDSSLPIPADLTIARYVELGVTGSLLTRAFTAQCQDMSSFVSAVGDLRERVTYWRENPAERRQATQRLKELVAAATRIGTKIP